MPTYTYRIPTDLGIGHSSTGISLASNEYISRMSVKVQNKYVRIQYNSLDQPGFEVGLCNSSKSLSERITSYAYSSSGIKDGTYMYFKNDAEYAPTENFLSLTGTLYAYLKGSKYVNGSKVDAVSGDMSLKSYIDITLTTAYTISITTQVSPANTGSISSISANYAGAVVNINATPETGYKFKNWSATAGTFGSTTSASTTYTFPNANATITATFEKNSYTLTTAVSPSGGGTVTAGASIQYQGTKSLTATPATGYRFVNWTKTSGTLSSTTSNPTTFTMGAGNATVTANFAKIDYTLSGVVDPSGSGTISFNKSTAQIGDTITITATPDIRYFFDHYGSSPSVTISNNQFTMPASNVTITAYFRPGKSTCSLNASSYSGGDTAILTINTSSSNHTHKYNLDFGDGMETGLIDVAAGISVVNIYIPVSWYMYLNGATSKSGGTLTLYTYSGSTLQGSYSIQNITYTVLNSTIPSLSVWRTDANGNKKEDGEYGSYTFVKPSSISTWSLSYNQTSKNSPASSGTILPSAPLTFTLGDNHLISFTMVYGNETIIVTSDLPAVVKVQKKILNTL